MQVTKVNIPQYQITLTAEEMTQLWALARNAHNANISQAAYFYNKLEDIRPVGGFNYQNEN